MSPNKNAKATPPDELHQQLAYLNLTYMIEHVEELVRQAADKQWSHMAFLARLVEGETALRQDRARARRIQQARFPVLKTLEQFDFTWPAKINRLAVQNLFRLKFIQDKANSILIGGVGLGKSHLAVALGYAACLAGFRVRFTTAIDIINTLSAADRAGRLVRCSAPGSGSMRCRCSSRLATYSQLKAWNSSASSMARAVLSVP